ncbi:GNAT family N-acetyltransferase [Bacillus pacificus]|uniref:GNAT family N-acetyltransferase n=1 Tax=Bacillus pacificus TaxID=2026187 RepID=UPI000667A41A|nr:acetyltransferase [Bacillus cereus]KXZ02960.1 acetyltransferase [Bacillus cereus]MBL3794016.1 GNAT family N-acetyltransferase [Bacillus cereus]MBL3855976.1 GNAT family N-acetyltransferase [Bacillus cereus]HDR7965397.1 GNAT family N-acetyltransferase [Bacillus pacificus]
MKIPVLEGNIVCLRSVEPEKDYKQWYEVMKDPDMHHWTGNVTPKDSNEIKDLLHTYKNLKDIMAWAIVMKQSKEMIGTYWISMPIMNEKKLIVTSEAQRIARKYWRTGVNREARNLIYNYIFLTLDVDEVHAQAWDKNINSCRSMEQIGFKLEKQVECLFPKYNKMFLENHYVLYKKDWQEKKSDPYLTRLYK